jgi:hypothetical protein
VAISTTVHPRAHTSAAAPCASPRAASGAMNAGVPPPTAPAPPPLSSAVRRAHPKSASMARPSARRSTFRPFTSQCANPAAWTWASPRRTSAARARITASSHRPPRRPISSAIDPPGAYSRNRSKRFPPQPSADTVEPKHDTTYGDGARTSSTLCSRFRNPASAASTVFTANTCPVRRSAAIDTVADAPRPMTGPRCHSPIAPIPAFCGRKNGSRRSFHSSSLFLLVLAAVFVVAGSAGEGQLELDMWSITPLLVYALRLYRRTPLAVECG